jgi:SAM-dependent methyltransferase
MKQYERPRFVEALESARLSAYAAGEFVGQESFMRASEILALAAQAGVGPETSVLDLCCGVAGPGRFITEALGCTYLGVDASPSAIGIARDRAGDLACRFAVAQIPPVPTGPFDVVLLLETMLAFLDKATLLRQVAAALPVGGRFAFTLEEGPPLTAAERRRMPDADTVWLVPLPEIVASLERAGMRLLWYDECSQSHLAVVDSLMRALAADATEITARLGPRALDELLRTHRLWSDWLRSGRVRKFAVVAQKSGSS